MPSAVRGALSAVISYRLTASLAPGCSLLSICSDRQMAAAIHGNGLLSESTKITSLLVSWSTRDGALGEFFKKAAQRTR